MILFSLEEKFNRQHEKTHAKYFFDVPFGVSALKIKFKYSPKEGADMQKMLEETLLSFAKYAPFEKNALEEAKKCLPLVNHIGLSVDSPLGWVGSRHNHCPDSEFTIGKNSTVGFADAEITEGKWAVTLSFNSIVTQAVTCFVEVAAI
jgi:hypothetical protein